MNVFTSPDHSLNASFRKADDFLHLDAAGQNVLGVIRYCTDPDATASRGPGVELRLPMATDSTAEFAEVWTTTRPVRTGEYQGIHYAHDGEYLLCTCRVAASPRYANITERAYSSVLEVLHDLEYENPFRMWNFIGNINRENADGLEIYRDFCLGRSRAFQRYSLPTGKLCAATCVGTLGCGIAFYSLSLKSGDCIHLDNPRQVAPYRYPQRYGPRSPSFARATYVRPAGQAKAEPRMYVSGTSSIVGHETVHRGDLESQCLTALGNIRCLIEEDNTARYGLTHGYGLADLDQIKIYVRHAEHIPLVRNICSKVLSPDAEIAYLNLDMCRSDLLVEIEGVAR